MGSVGSVKFQEVPCSSLYLLSRSISPFQCLVNVNDRVLTGCTCHFQSGSFLYILGSSFFKSLQGLISAVTQGAKLSSVHSLSHVWLFTTPWTATRQASLSITNSQSPPKPMSIELVMPSNHPILCYSLLYLPSIFTSISGFTNKSALRIRWLKYWSFSPNISPSNEHPGPISFRMDWLDLLAVQGTLKNLLQHHSSET